MSSWPHLPEYPSEHSSEEIKYWDISEIILRPPNDDCLPSRQTLTDYVSNPPDGDIVPDEVWLAIFHARTCASPECQQLYLAAWEV